MTNDQQGETNVIDTIDPVAEAEQALELSRAAEAEATAELEAARVALQEAEGDQAQGVQLVELRTDQLAMGQCSRGDRDQAKRRLAERQEATEVARAKVRHLERDAAQAREAVIAAERTDRFSRQRDAEGRSVAAMADIKSFIEELEGALLEFDEVALDISFESADGRRHFPVIPPSSLLAGAVVVARRRYGLDDGPFGPRFSAGGE